MPHTSADLDRTLTRLVAVCALAIGGLWAAETVVRPGEMAWWWVWGYATLFAAFLALAVAAEALPLRVLRRCWIALPTAGFGLQLVTAGAHHTPMQSGAWEYSWMLTGVLLCLLTLTERPGRRYVRINVFAGLVALLPAVSFCLAYGRLPDDLLTIALVQFTNVAYPMLFIAVRARFFRYRRVQDRWRARVVDTAVMRAKLHEERRLGRPVHDNILGVLTAAAWTRGPVPEELRTSARNALTLLDDCTEDAGAEFEVGDVAALLYDALMAVDPRQDLQVDGSEGSLPEECVTALVEASLEALRNSVKHAPDAHRIVRVSLAEDVATVTIEDDGPGFIPEMVPGDRLGVTSSILGRMEDLSGGSGHVQARPGVGTHVHLSWTREAVAA